MNNTKRRLDRARCEVMRRIDLVFYAPLVMRLEDKLGTKGSCQTACTDGRSIFWHEPWVDQLTEEELLYVLLHEALHCAHLHLWRLRKDKIGNLAGDHAINLLLNTLPGIKMPKGGFADPRFKNMAEESIDAILRAEAHGGQQPGGQQPGGQQPGGQQPGGQQPGGQQPGGQQPGGQQPGGQQPGGQQPGGQQPGDDPGGCGGFIEPFEDITDPDEGLHDEWVSAIIQANIAAKSAGLGGMPSHLGRMLERRLAPKVCWKQEMAEFIRSNLPVKNDWARSSRRMATQPCIYPRRVRDQVGKVIFVRDTSGSISSGIVAQFNSLIADSLREMDNSCIIIDADDRVIQRYDIADPEAIPTTAKGGGDTDFRPVFREVRKLVEEGVEVAGIVYLTDLDGPEPLPQDVDHPLLWVSTTWRKGKTGRTVAVEV